MTTNRKHSLIPVFIVLLVAVTTLPTLFKEKQQDTNPKQPVFHSKDTSNHVLYSQSGMQSAKMEHTKQQPSGQQTTYLAMPDRGIIGKYLGTMADSPDDNLFSVVVDQPLNNDDAVWLTYRLTGLEDYSNVGCRINDRLAFGGSLVKKNQKTSTQKVPIASSWLTKGVNTIQFGLPDDADYGCKISHVAVMVQKGGLSTPIRFAVGNQSYDGQVHVQGFFSSGGRVSLKANGQPINIIDKAFEALVPIKDSMVHLVAQVDGQSFSQSFRVAGKLTADKINSLKPASKSMSKTFTIEKEGLLESDNAALYVNKSTMKSSKRLSLTPLRSVDIPPMDVGLANVTQEDAGFRFLPHGEHFNKPATVAIKYDRTKIPDGYTEDDILTFFFDVSSKRWVALEKDSLNKDLCVVYSKTTHFTDMINGVVKVPESPETQGFVSTMMNDIKAADPTSGIGLMAPPTPNNMGTASLSYPLEIAPVRGSVNPGLALRYNSDGGDGWLGEGWDLSIPSITVDTRWGVPRYDPYYETETYTFNGVTLATVLDTMTTLPLGGVIVPHKGLLYQRMTGDANNGLQFHPVTEKDFSLITRLGNSPANYYWKVTTKEGVSYTYGEKSRNAALGGIVNTFNYTSAENPQKVQAPKSAIAEWLLSTIEDQYRNFCRFTYVIDSTQFMYSGVWSKHIRLSRVEIGRKKLPASYGTDTIYQVIDFIQKTVRTKHNSSARYGFLTSPTPLLLDSVSVRLKEPNGSLVPVRNYTFSYKDGLFNTKLLQRISQLDVAGAEVAFHSLDYSNNVLNGLFDEEEAFNTTSVEETNSANSLPAETSGLPALGGSVSKNWSAGFHVGVGVGTEKLGGDVGYDYSFSKATSETRMMMIDINGDALPDKVYLGKNNDAKRLCFIPNLGEGQFGSCGIIIYGYDGALSKSSTRSNNNGWSGKIKVGGNKANVTVNAGMTWLKADSETTTYFQDVNGDGLVDVVDDGTVYFNSVSTGSIDGVTIAIPSLSTNSGESPRPVKNVKSIRGKADALNLSDLFTQTPTPSEPETLSPFESSDPPIERDSDIVMAEMIEDYQQVPMQDMVRFWEAPRDGVVQVRSHIEYLGRVDMRFADGVRMAIQTDGSEIWCDSIKPNDATLERNVQLNNIGVTKGQRVYFRLQSGSDYFSDGQEDIVLWEQEVEYLNTNWILDENGQPTTVFLSSEGSFVNQQNEFVIDSNYSYNFKIKGFFSKPITQEPLHLKLIAYKDQFITYDSIVTTVFTDSLTGRMDTTDVIFTVSAPNPNYSGVEVLWEHDFGKDSVIIDNQQIGNEFGASDGRVNLRFEISSNTNVPWDQVIWKPVIHCEFDDVDTTLYSGVKYGIFENNPQQGEGNVEYFQGIFVYNPLPNFVPSVNDRVIPSIQLNTSRCINTDYTLVLNRIRTNSHGKYVESIDRFYGTITNGICDATNFYVDTLFEGNYFFSLYLNDTINPALINATCHFQQADPSTSYIPNKYTLLSDKRATYGHMWRGWGQFQYNAGNGRHARPLVEDSLFLVCDTTQQTLNANIGMENMYMIALTHKPYKNCQYWGGSNDYLLIAGDTMCTGRLNHGEMPSILVPKYVPDEEDLLAGGLNRIAIKRGMARTASTNPLTGTMFTIDNAPKLSSTSSSTSAWGGASASIGKFSVGATPSGSLGDTKVTSAYLDMNGDGFPDYITDNKVEYTNANGGRDGEIATINPETSDNSSFSVGFSGSLSASKPIGSKPYTGKNVPNTGNASSSDISLCLSSDKNASLGYSYSENTSMATNCYMDLNGDGMPDRLYTHGNELRVCFNKGYGFTQPINWGVTKINETTSSSRAANASFGVAYNELLQVISDAGGKTAKKAIDLMEKLHLGVSVGVNGVRTTSYSLFNLFDINSDGLADKVYKNADGHTVIAFNTGTSFTEVVSMESIEEFFKSLSEAYSGNLAISINIRILSFKLVLGASGSIGKATEYTLNQMMDIDADGFPDVLAADKTDDYLARLRVKRSLIGCTNKLSSVKNSFGGSMHMDYARTAATYDHPGGKWVMSSLSVNDGFLGDGDSLLTHFDYTDGRYDRYERAFLGFSEVKTEYFNTAETSLPVYKKLYQTFDNSNYYTRGALLSTELKGVTGEVEKLYSSTINTYHTYAVNRKAHGETADLGKFQLESIDPSTDLDRVNHFLQQHIVYTPIKYSKNVLYDVANQSSMTTSEEHYAYHTSIGTHGELSTYTFSDKGTLGASGTGGFNYRTTINYLRNKPSMTLFSLPEEVVVTGSDNNVYRHTKAEWNDDFANQLKVVKHILAAGDTATTTMGYDQWGNICQKELPGKNKSDRMWYTYQYDPHYHLFPTQVSDRFGYTSSMSEYNHRFGVPGRTTDINGQAMLTTVDGLGRVTAIRSPHELANGIPYTLSFAYHPQATVSSGAITAPAYAVTKHYDEANPGNDLETVTFSDGFGRAIQVKKDGFIDNAEVSIVSGRVVYDAFGRAIRSYYPLVETNPANKYVFNAGVDNIAPTVTQYDVLDRVVSITEPDGATTSTAYQLDEGLLKTTVTDAKNGQQATYTNGSGLTLSASQLSGPDGQITTQYAYDCINRPVRVTDTKGHQTVSVYDKLGRRTSVTHPASGTTRFSYDLAGNLVAKQTAELAKRGDSITYVYECNRLKEIHYPGHPENDVTYVYGTKTDTGATNGFRAGRLKYLIDGSGAREYTYGRMGEVTQERRTLIIPNQAVATYVMGWTYDAWNRVRTMTYPDGEQLTYEYNPGGLLKTINGVKDNEQYTYVHTINYDKFERRTYICYSNNVAAEYTYNEQSRNLSNLKVVSTYNGNRCLMDNAYTYDAVDNVTKVTNTAPIPSTGIGGNITHNYTYDGLYRLQTANGFYQGNAGKIAAYNLVMAYDNLHTITGKKLDIGQVNLQFTGELETGYDLTYAYNSTNDQQLTQVADTGYRWLGNPTPLTGQLHRYSYDASGNLTQVLTTRTEPIPRSLPQAPAATREVMLTNRRLLWDEENRLTAVSDNGYVSTYLYDASGERTVKLTGDGEGMTVNGRLSGGRTGTDGFTAYVNPYVVISGGSRLSKHIYAGSQRIVSKLCASGSSPSNPLIVAKAAESVVNYTAKYAALKASVAARYDSLGLPFLGTDHAGTGFWTSTPTTRETDQYFYHPDHLGSSSLITTLGGVLAQHLEYLPFGEVLVDERATPTTRSTPYKFNAKELDEETGLYYYSARYLDPRLSLWLSVDPLAEKYPGFGSYIYCRNNPVRLIDPDGRSDEESSGKPAKLQANGVMSTAQSSIRTEPPQRLTNLRNSPEPYGGEIKRADMFSTFESWLNKPSESIMEAVGKITLNIAYSMGNSPFSLLTGRTIGGKSLNSEEKIQSFIDVVPLGVIEGLKISGTVVNTTNKGISGFNKFKESIGPISSKDLPTGMKWQENASQLYKSNKTQSQSLNDFDKFVNAIGFSDVVKSEINK